MTFRTSIFAACLFAFTLSLGLCVSRAQEEPQQPPPENPQQPAPDTPYEPFPQAPPKPAGSAFPAFEIGGEGELQPDFSPLTGMQNTTLGFPEMRHSYWVPGAQFSSNINSNPSGTNGNTNWTNTNYFVGNVSLLEAWSRATMAVNYSGGGYVSNISGQGSGHYEELALAQNYRSERWLIQVVDRFSYIPQSSFGFGGGTGLGIPGVGGSLGTTIPSLGGNYIPNQTIYGVGAFYNNVGALQGTYALSRRASVTISGSYGILRFVNSGNSDSNTTVGSIGYNYALSRNDTVGFVYRFSSYQYPGNPQAYGDHVFSVAYGRKITGRIGLRLFAGPEITEYRVPVGGSSRKTGFSTSATMTYGLENGNFTLGYIHGLSGGSGVLVGSILDQANATFSHKLTRAWTGSLNFGYARNGPLGGTANTGYPAYDDYFFGGNVARPIGRFLNFAAAYTATRGSYAGYASGCTGIGCSGTTQTTNTFTINLQWHPRPFVFR